MLQTKNKSTYFGLENELQLVVMHVDKAVIKKLEIRKYHYGYVFETDKGEKVEMVFMLDAMEDFSHWYTRFEKNAKIIRKEKITSLPESARAGLLHNNFIIC